MLKKSKSLIIILFITFSSSAFAGWVTRLNIPSWYESLNKLSFSPPNWIFAPVWTTLYLMMSIAIWNVYENAKSKREGNKLLIYYFGHLFINFAWSFVFFYFHLIFLAFINILFLIIAIIVLMVIYFPRSKVSFYLMIPYLLWVLFAGALNFGLYLIN